MIIHNNNHSITLIAAFKRHSAVVYGSENLTVETPEKTIDYSITIEANGTYFRRKMGAFSPPSLLFEDLLERFFDTVGVDDERAKDGIGLAMLTE